MIQSPPVAPKFYSPASGNMESHRKENLEDVSKTQRAVDCPFLIYTFCPLSGKEMLKPPKTHVASAIVKNLNFLYWSLSQWTEQRCLPSLATSPGKCKGQIVGTEIKFLLKYLSNPGNVFYKNSPVEMCFFNSNTCDGLI